MTPKPVKAFAATESEYDQDLWDVYHALSHMSKDDSAAGRQAKWLQDELRDRNMKRMDGMARQDWKP